jgi:4-hydroxy-tetrahydrodipicolinate reductase
MSGAPVRVTLFGTGRVGTDVTRLAATRTGVQIVAAASRNPGHRGRDLGELAGAGVSGVAVAGSLEEALSVPSDVLVVATASFLRDVAEALEAGVRAGRAVLTTSEEAAYPWIVDEPLAQRLDELARGAGVAVAGLGINPGFVFDALVATLTGAAWDVASIEVERVVDLSGFGANVLTRLGVGLDPDDFRRGAETGEVTGHIGFPQSIRIVARSLGRTLDRIERTIVPIVAEAPLTSRELAVPAGRVGGFRQHYRGIVAGETWFEAHLIGHLDPPSIGEPLRDLIRIHGAAELALDLRPGLNAQSTVAAVLVNSVERIRRAEPGWRLVTELPPALAQA